MSWSTLIGIAAASIGRLLDLFPKDMQPAVRSALVFNMKGIVAQKLLPSIKEGLGRVPGVGRNQVEFDDELLAGSVARPAVVVLEQGVGHGAVGPERP